MPEIVHLKRLILKDFRTQIVETNFNIVNSGIVVIALLLVFFL